MMDKTGVEALACDLEELEAISGFDINKELQGADFAATICKVACRSRDQAAGRPTRDRKLDMSG